MRLLTSVLSILSVASVLTAQPVTKKIDLLEVIKSGNVEHHVNPKADFHDDPKDIWTFAKDGTFNISGRGYGYVATKGNYRDYHLVIEFKWGAKTWGKREKAAKDNGILLHAYGPHGAYGDTWMASIEAQIIEGGVGDILVLSPKLADGTELTTSLSAEFTLDRDKEKIWKKGELRQTVTKGRINWKGRDEDWADKVGFRGKNDVESPSGEWNRLEVIAKGDTLQYFVNGALINEAFDCKPAEGKILLQTEGAEMIVRRYELYPLGEFKEKWSAIQASGGSDIGAVRDGQDQPLSPEESMKRIQLDGDYEVQLVAAEPLVLDPVEATWDDKGRMFVADMRDYPLGPPNPGDPWLSRIQLLTDEDGDGRMDKAVTFADHMDNVQGLLPYNGGLIATTRSQILFLKDTNGDNVADEIKPLIRGFNPKHSQLQVSAPRWGLDGCVHFNNGLDAREIYPADAPTKVVGIPGSNFKWNPKTGEITPTGGKGQYGGAFDDYGHHFYCSNRNPLMFTVMPYEAMLRNPHAGITQVHEDIATPGAETRVYPLQITHTTADAHAGTNTACSGLGVYRGQLMPELRNNVFVPDPTGQLVTRYKVEPNGASLKATRVGDRTEFFRSSDEWSRPVNFTTGPDGAIYICDIYRRWIDHARFFPEEFVKTHDMRQGENHGRIWRVVPKGTKKLVTKTPGKYHAIPEVGWGKVPAEHADRALFLKVPGITDAKELAAILTKHADDPWMAKMVASASSKQMGRILSQLSDSFFSTFSEDRSTTVRTFAAGALADAEAEDVKAALFLLQKQPGQLLWWKPALLQGLAKLPKGHEDAAKEIAALQSKIDAIVADAKAPLDQRLAVLPLLSTRKWAAVEPVMKSLLTSNQPAEMTTAAVALLKKFAATSTAPLIYELLPKAGPALKRDLAAILTANATTALELFKRMEKGEFPTAWVDVEKRWSYQRGKGEMADLAKKLFGEASSDRAAVVKNYMAATTMHGDAKKGQAVFATICITCHKHGTIGVDVGPPLSDVKVKPPEGLLSDILDPNRMFEARWSAYQIDTKDGRTLSGLIQSETSDSVVLAMMGGAKETLSRSAIKEMKSLDRTLMPVGLEAAITKEQMGDLLAFLLGK
ncbi:PVC-type heme-binding CxxCH protein [Prosthecobacter sp.]|uniref:PVC-type heme-binding CxxCH protein n=1 Tax=Prosthecobacter sp. TaxID=1965333 RepID=UPI002AB9A9CA|nr:PVC-type heme-binding CxxCH protein [Prosthecobacter sp.]MDZ4403686.1 PVC-type heme-binding CxxCH protein [Prosthecobacter sp.]